jgi:hypothetical protein
MGGTYSHRLPQCVAWLSLALAWLVAAPAARAIEAMGGRLQFHGFGEMQMRGLANDFEGADDWDFAQWWNVLNLEIEYDIAPDGVGPLDLLSMFARFEVRYDCTYRHGCGMLNSVDTWGDRAAHLPKRLSNGRLDGVTSGNLPDFDTRQLHSIPGVQNFARRREPVGDPHEPLTLDGVPGFSTLVNSGGPDGIVGTADDPGRYVFERWLRPGSQFKFGTRRTKGTVYGVGTQVLGPWLPKNKIIPIGALADRVNPMQTVDHPYLRSADRVSGFDLPKTQSGNLIRGGLALPLRPAPEIKFPEWRPLDEARGLYIPNKNLVSRLSDFDNPDVNFRQAELEWNRGASQQDEKELKEFYFDLEMLDSRLWMRLGKQQIVWGKTELFRTTDQFNPQDVALASLPSLEESRIALWGARAVWSFFEVGPLDDVRFEVAANLDDFEPTDLGRCGEPYTPDPVCNKSFGLFAHGNTGVGLAGEVKPVDWWNGWHGLEIGARLEFRLGRFSFQISDFYGFNDFAHAVKLFGYERNVDPVSGRPRRAERYGDCINGTETDCLTAQNALTEHPINQQLFAVICATTVGFSNLDRSACAQTVFNSKNLANPAVAPAFTIGMAVNTLLRGGTIGATQVWPALIRGAPGQDTFFAPFFVRLNRDPADGVAAVTNDAVTNILLTDALNPFLTREQMGLLGCGPFYGTNCDIDGIDLMNMEVSAVVQSWPGFEGTDNQNWDATGGALANGTTGVVLRLGDDGLQQPGTTGFEGGPVCTRFEDGRTWILPGCRGPSDPGYDINVDGSILRDGFGGAGADGDLRHPFTGQLFRNEMAAVSWNALVALVGLSLPADLDNDRQDDEPADDDDFDRRNPFRDDGCSWVRPHMCSNVRAFWGVTGLTRNTVRASGSRDPRFGRRDMVWAGGGAVFLDYEKRNVLGFSLDFAEDVTKSNWGMEATWIEGLPFTDNDASDGLTYVDTFNMTVSVDRPTFINFLNQNRTFFFNSQVFFQYIKGWETSMTANGPFNVLGTFTVTTGYFQDRLLPGFTFVYDFASNSGAFLPSVTYRFTENFSVQFGLAGFWGKYQRRTMPFFQPGTHGDHVGPTAYRQFVENGLSVVKARDEAFLRIRYTF